MPKEWADQYKGDFDDGWDAYREKVFKRQKELGIVPKDAELSRHDPDVQDWKTLSADERKLYARMMEVFAGFVTHTDHHYGRLFAFLKSIGAWDNTLIMFISDNGASAEGGPTGSVNENKFFNNVPDSLAGEPRRRSTSSAGRARSTTMPWGWTHAGNTPFRRWKRETYRGGVSDPFIVHWPKGIKAKGQVRTQYAHAIDMVPTVLEALGIEAPTSIKGRDAVADRGAQLRARLRRCEGAVEARDAVLRDVRPPVDLSRRLARSVPVAGHVVQGVGSRVRRPDRCARSSPSWTRRAGSCITSRRTSPRTTTWRRRSGRS